MSLNYLFMCTEKPQNCNEVNYMILDIAEEIVRKT